MVADEDASFCRNELKAQARFLSVLEEALVESETSRRALEVVKEETSSELSCLKIELSILRADLSTRRDTSLTLVALQKDLAAVKASLDSFTSSTWTCSCGSVAGWDAQKKVQNGCQEVSVDVGYKSGCRFDGQITIPSEQKSLQSCAEAVYWAGMSSISGSQKPLLCEELEAVRVSAVRQTSDSVERGMQTTADEELRQLFYECVACIKKGRKAARKFSRMKLALLTLRLLLRQYRRIPK